MNALRRSGPRLRYFYPSDTGAMKLLAVFLAGFTVALLIVVVLKS